MSAIEHGVRKGYKAGCRCDLCKRADSEYRQDLKARKAVSEAAVKNQVHSAVRLASVPFNPSTSGNAALNIHSSGQDATAQSTEAAVRQEIETLTSPRPGLVAVALELARVLDDPRATSSKAPAAGRLVDVLERLRKGTDTRKSRLASVRAMTSLKT